jgi:two-component system, OmpR family, KDP operon response regulator KdpE
MLAAEILIVNANEQMRRVLRTRLAAENYSVREAATAAGAALLVAQEFFDVILLDLNLPDGNALKVIRKAKNANPGGAIIVLSKHISASDKINALDAGADDVIGKPITMEEVLARLRATLRRSSEISGRIPISIYRTGEIEVNLRKRSVLVAGREVHLTRIEFELLQVLIHHADQIVSRNHLLKEVWDGESQTHYLRIYMLQLRRKLELDPSRPRYLLTEPGVGYRLVTWNFPDAWRHKPPQSQFSHNRSKA